MSASGSRFCLRFGALAEEAGVRFRVWAPRAKTLAVRIVNAALAPVPMVRSEDGVFEVLVEGIRAGADYMYVIDGERERPDPVSRLQPHGVHGPSRVVLPVAPVQAQSTLKCPAVTELLLYELHVGTFTPEGTFDAVIGKLGYLRELGVNALELMPVAAFPGTRNWGYDGVHPYAPQWSYGGADGLRRLVSACHSAGLAVLLDVVYNHLGPEGNYLSEYGPYFTDRYHTPWGSALNFDGDDAAYVRRYFIDNALYWLNDFQFDGLRLDAIHGIFDESGRHILEELSAAVHEDARRAGRNVLLIAESDLNDPRMITPREQGGYGFDAQWSDDFHHALHTRLSGSQHGYFADFGQLAQLEKALTEGFVYDGCYSVFRRRKHGASSKACPGDKFVVFSQNHDQIANGSGGKRHSNLLTRSQQNLAAFMLLVVAPNVPLLFMGQEYGETAPFLYFTSHGDPGLAKAVSEGRKAEFAGFGWEKEHHDPQAADTFEASKLDWSKLNQEPHAGTLRLYHDLLRLRARNACLRNGCKDFLVVERSGEDWLLVQRSDPSGASALAVVNFSKQPQKVPIFSAAGPNWRLALHTGNPKYGALSTHHEFPERLNCDGGATPYLFCLPFEAVLYLHSEQQ